MPASIPRWAPPRLKVESTKERAHYLSAEWRALRARILVRDACRCRACSRVVNGKAAHVDHVVPLEDGGTDHPDNLQTLCEACHGRKTRAEQGRRGLL
mgnify:CR=1 FL=1